MDYSTFFQKFKRQKCPFGYDPSSCPENHKMLNDTILPNARTECDRKINSDLLTGNHLVWFIEIERLKSVLQIQKCRIDWLEKEMETLSEAQRNDKMQLWPVFAVAISIIGLVAFMLLGKG